MTLEKHRTNGTVNKLGVGLVREALAMSVFGSEIRSPGPMENAARVLWLTCGSSTREVQSVHSQSKLDSSVSK